MSNYFDALMRASGLPLGTAPVIGPARQAAKLVNVIEAMVPAAQPQASVVRPAQSAIPALPTLQRNTAAFAGAALPNDVNLSATSATTGLTDLPPHVVQEAVPPIVVRTQDEHGARVGKSPELQSTNLGDRLVQAAVRWVAADPPDNVTAATALQPSELASSTAAVTGFTTEVQQMDTWRGPDEIPAQLIKSQGHVQETRVRERSDAAQVAIGLPNPLQSATLPHPHRPLHFQEEQVDISIGTIHLRVDAPAPPTVQTITIPRQQTDASARPHSGLSRRALYRI